MAIKFISGILELHAQNNFMIGVIRESLKLDGLQSPTTTSPTVLQAQRTISSSSSSSLSTALGSGGGVMKPGRMARICSVSDVKGYF